MKTLVAVCSLIVALAAGHARAQQYEVAPQGTTDFTTFANICCAGGTIALDIYLTGVTAPQNAGGAWVDFTGSVSDIAYVSGGRCMQDGSEGCTGPWTSGGGSLVNEPAGPGTLMYAVLNFSGAAPTDGNLIVGTVTLQYLGCDACNDAVVQITTIPSFATWSPIDDAEIGNGFIMLQPIGAPTNEACDDGLFCNGQEYAYACSCMPGTPPCDDGDPCTVNACDENTKTCSYGECAATQPFDLCCKEPVCDGAAACYCWGDFDCDGDVDADDVTLFLADFGREQYYLPCTNADSCNGDFDCDGDVDADDVSKFLEDFGREEYFNPCPPCIHWWCGYPQ